MRAWKDSDPAVYLIRPLHLPSSIIDSPLAQSSIRQISLPAQCQKKSGRVSSDADAGSIPLHPVISSPSNFVKLSGMGMDEAGLAAANSVIADVNHSHDGGAVGEPLVQDIFQVESSPEPILQELPHTPSNKIDYQSLGRHPVASSSEEDIAPPPPDFTRRGIHIPTRTSSKSASKRRRFFRSSSAPSNSMPATPKSSTRLGSSADSVISYETTASSSNVTVNLAPLQHKGLPDETERLSPLLEDDPQSFDLVAPNEVDTTRGSFSLETRSEDLFSKEHLEAIFLDTPSLLRFTSFLSIARPKSVPVLIYYLDALKALRAINYANAVAEALDPIDGHEFTENPARPTVNAILEEKARHAFDVLVRDDLPAFITHIFVQVVSVSIQKRVTGNLPPLLRETSEGLAEVFCLTDPSRPDNPIIFASEEFHRTTQYGVSYAIGRNCRFLQGPRTNRNTTARLKQAIVEGKEISEVFLNYRRDGSPFMNLLMMAPLLDSRGTLRYFIGAQVDVSGLAKDASDLDAFQRLLNRREGTEAPEDPKDELQELSEMFNNVELDTVRRFGGNMHREHLEEQDDASMFHRPRLLIKDPGSGDEEKPVPSTLRAEGRLSGVYKHYLLIRPHPSLRILFTSPSLRVPGVLQSRFLDRIGGSTRVRDSVAEALADGTRGVTAKVRWLSTAAPSLESDRVEEGRPRWIHCTPLLGQSGAVGVWMVVLVDDDKGSNPTRRFRPAPPVATDVRRQQHHQRERERERERDRAVSPGGYAGAFESSGDEVEIRPGRFSLVDHVNSSRTPRSHHMPSARKSGGGSSILNDQRAARADRSEKSHRGGNGKGIMRTTTFSSTYEEKLNPEGSMSNPSLGVATVRKMKRYSAG
ncbi:hypothetical protein B0J11DRAFT_526637 [Dendryphion nanum]|uniref:PAC domain-containing protein n=1 Tax=Dendryphion nanum TaxID=256645 RepID=A0A9P9DX67_9PLEO|nr:hypothetical protein B0J11DRAFT_526637 [Dendryphion nanum]